MGRNEKSNQWIIIEANPAWSSGIYGCDPKLVIDVLEIACNNPDNEWLWEPAENLVKFANNQEPMRIVDVSDASGVFKL